MYIEEIPLQDLQGPLSASLNYWRRLGGERLACSWRDFKLQDLPAEVIPTTLVIDVFDDQNQNRIRFWGTGLTYIHGQDMTGKSPYTMPPKGFGESLRDQHSEVRKTREGSARLLGFQHDAGFIHTHTALRLPLSNDTRSVDQIVVVTWYTDDAWKLLKDSGGEEFWDKVSPELFE